VFIFSLMDDSYVDNIDCLNWNTKAKEI
jgi:hypothetical protein